MTFKPPKNPPLERIFRNRRESKMRTVQDRDKGFIPILYLPESIFNLAFPFQSANFLLAYAPAFGNKACKKYYYLFYI